MGKDGNVAGKIGNKFILRICMFIVDKHVLFLLLFTLLGIFSAFSYKWVNVKSDISEYLPAESETSKGLNLMKEQFVTYAEADVMVANISYDQALLVKRDLEKLNEVFSVELDESEEHYNNGSALFYIVMIYDQNDPKAYDGLAVIQKFFKGYDCYVASNLVDMDMDIIDREVLRISIIVLFIVIIVLHLTSEAYADIFVYLIVFGYAALIQQGTNFLYGTISFVSYSVSIILQLALSVDYSVIFLNRFKEERAEHDVHDACVIALSKAIPEVTGCSLTTVGGLISMLFMQVKVVGDMGMVLIKAIAISMLCVFLFMPGVIILFSGSMERTKHKKFIPKIPFVGRFAYRTRYVVPPLFVLFIIVAFKLSLDTPYVYGYSKIEPPITNEIQVAEKMIGDNFKSNNSVVLVFPTGDYEIQKELIDELLLDNRVEGITGLANTQVINGHTLTEKLTPRQFSELVDIDYEVSELIYAAYAVDDEDYAKAINTAANYKVPLIDMFEFVYTEVKGGYVDVGGDLEKELDYYHSMLTYAKNQLQGTEYDRIVIYLNLPEESDETFAFMDEIHEITEKYYAKDDFYLVGSSVVEYDLKKYFARDNLVTTIISVISVLFVLLSIFKSAGMPLLLIAVIQGCIWINFAVPSVTHDNIFFLSYLIVCAIQMGANIDYAIVIASRYTSLRPFMGKKAAIIDTMNLSFPTIITSGTMLAAAGTLIGRLTSQCSIYGIGKFIGRGTVISIFVTMFILPQILLMGDKVIEMTTFLKTGDIESLNVKKKPSEMVNAKKMLSLLLVGFVAFNLLSVTVCASSVTDYNTGVRERSIRQIKNVDTDIEKEREARISKDVEEIYISTAADFKKFAENCVLDTWSINKKVILKNDIKFNPDEIVTVPTFGGYFDGAGHKLSQYTLSGDVSNYAMFSTLQETGVITNLSVVGRILPSGDQSTVGGIVANNYGLINNCQFNGMVSADSYAGGIVAINQLTGQVQGCTSQGFITGMHFIGGIAGENRGYISECKNDALINTTQAEAQIDIINTISDVVSFVKQLNRNPMNSKNVDVSITDIGGIAGQSVGVIQNCYNSGSVGVAHMGYNIGGIAGRQSGYISGCINNSRVMGRKDVGGIVGHAEPYITVDLDSSTATKLTKEINKLNSQLTTVLKDTKEQSTVISNRMAAIQTFTSAALVDVAYVSNGTIDYANKTTSGGNDVLSRANYILRETSKNSGIMEHSGNAIDDVEAAVENIRCALDHIDITTYMDDEDKAKFDTALEQLQSTSTWTTLRGATGILSLFMKYLPHMTGDVRDDALATMQEIEKATKELEIAAGKIKDTSKTLADSGSVKLGTLDGDYRSHANSLISNIYSMNDNFGLLNQEANNATGRVIDDLQAVNNQFSVIMSLFAEAIGDVNNLGLDTIYEDVSLRQVDTTTDATIDSCSNYGQIQADIDGGGIAGVMGIEYDTDLERISPLVEEASITSRYISNCVLRDNKNYNSIVTEKDYAGGICGLQEMGAVKLCNNYGGIKTSAGEYAGGICGQSISYIISSNSRGIVDGQHYIGGIAGDGSNIRDCYAVVKINRATSYYGAIAGHIADNGVVRNNYFVSDNLAGLDKVNYAIKAEPIEITDENLPEDLRKYTVVFTLNDQENEDGELMLKRVEKNYGDSLSEDEFPSLPEKEGYYVVWSSGSIPNVQTDEIITSEYVKYRTTIGEDTTGGRGYYQSDILVDGKFKQGDVLTVEREYQYDVDLYKNMAPRINGVTDYETLKLTIPDDGQSKHQIRFKSSILLGDVEYGPQLFVAAADGKENALKPTGKIGNYNTYEVDGNDLFINVRFTGNERVAYKYLFQLLMIALGVGLNIGLVFLVKLRRSLHQRLVYRRDTVLSHFRNKAQIFYNDEHEEVVDTRMKSLNIEGRRHNLPRVLKYIDSRLDRKHCQLNNKLMIDLAVEEIFLTMVRELCHSSDKQITVKYGYDKASRSVTLMLIDSAAPYNEFAEEDEVTLYSHSRNLEYLGQIMVMLAMDNFKYEYREGQNIYRMVKTI